MRPDQRKTTNCTVTGRILVIVNSLTNLNWRGRLLKPRNLYVAAALFVAVVAFNVITVAFKGVWTSGQAAKMWWDSIGASLPELAANWILTGDNSVMAGVNPIEGGILQLLFIIIAWQLWLAAPPLIS